MFLGNVAFSFELRRIRKYEIVGACSKLGVDKKFKPNKILKFEILSEVTIKNAAFWDVTLCGSCKDRRFGGTYPSIIKVTRIATIGRILAVTSHCSTRCSSVASYVVPSSPTLFSLMTEVIRSSELSVLKERKCVASQKAVFFIVSSVKNSNLRSCAEFKKGVNLHVIMRNY
jgi:hypothetical protein